MTEHLTYIDEHVRRIESSPERVWGALARMLGGQMGHQLPRLLVVTWGLEPPNRHGEWTTNVSVGDSIPAFTVAEADPPRRLVLRGRHRFSHYELRFELDSREPGGVDIHARTSASFPGLQGRIYHALVIGSGGHRLAVRRMLTQIARRSATEP